MMKKQRKIFMLQSSLFHLTIAILAIALSSNSITKLKATNSFFADLFVSDAFADAANSEMQTLMKYMGNKSVISVAPEGTSCVGGIVTGSKCDMTTCSVTTANVIQSSVNQGSGSLTCNTGYSGSPTYSCSGGVFTQTGGSCTAITCPVSVTGVSSPSSVGYTATSTNLTCNASGYTGTVSYTCTTGTLNIVSGSCTGTNPCTISNQEGIWNGQSVSSGSTSFGCNAFGYSGSITYTCNNGSFSMGSNSCSVTGSYNYHPNIGLNSSGAWTACNYYFNDCIISPGDCAGQGYCGGGGSNSKVCFGWEAGCSGAAGRVWRYSSSNITYGYWY